MNRAILSIGNFHIYWYSVLIATGIIIGLYLLMKEASKQNISKDTIIDIAFYTIIWGIIGARIYYVIFNIKPYLSNPLSILYVWEGGLAIYGGIIGGLITLAYQTKKKNIALGKLTDMIVPSLILAQAIGRWGNFFNQEAYGVSTTLQKLQSLKIPDFIIQGMYIDGVYYTPTFFYESLWCLLGVIILIVIRHLKYTRIGYQVSFYLMWYSVGRFVIESFRTDSLMLGYFKVAQIVSVVLFIVGLVIFLIQTGKPKLEEMYNSKEKIEVVHF